MGLLEDFGFSEDDNSSYEPEVQEDSNVVIPAPEGAPTDVSALRRGGSNDELRAAIVATAEKLGIDPVHLATAISYETGGTFDPWKRGPTTQWGTHRGLIQWGEPQAKQYGVSADTSVSDQLAAVGKYLIDRGVKPGMGLLDVYSAINAGRVGLYDRSDANNGGAPGTVRDKVEKQMGSHAKKAAALLGGMNAIAYAPDHTSEFPDYAPRSGPRRTGAAPGTGYIRLDNGRWGPAPEDVPPQAMFYGKTPKVSTARTPDYIRSGVPGLQKGYVPPEMRGPFRVNLGTPYSTGQATVAPPVTDSVDLHWNKLPAGVDSPGMPLDDGTPLDPAVVEQLQALAVPTTPVTPVLDESAGLNLAKTAPNISFVSTQPEAPLPAPVLNLPPKDQDSLLVTKGTLGPDAPSVPISGDNMPTPSFIEAQLPDAPKPPPASFMDLVNAAINPVKQFGAKVVGQATALPATGLAMLSSVFDQGTNTGGVTQRLLEEADKMKKGADFAFGVPEKGVTVGDKAGAFLGEIITPMGKHTATATALMGTAVGASEMIQGAQAKQEMTKKQAERLLFPGIGNNAQGGADEFAAPLAGPRVTHTVQTAAGPATLDESNFRLLGYMGAATIGALVAPSMARRILATSPFQRVGRIVEASPGVEAYSNRMDFIRTQDDKFAGIQRISRDLGVNPIALDEMQKVFDFSTGSGARNLTNSAVVTGKMSSPNFSYNVQTPIGKLVQVEAQIPEITEYLHLWNTLDEIKTIERGLSKKGNNAVANQVINAGHVQVRGMDKYTVNQSIRAMEASPLGQQLKDARAVYIDNQKTVRNFAGTGEYAIYSKRELQEMNRYELNKVHQNLDTAPNSPGIGHNSGAAPASEQFAVYQTNIMRERMENEARGLYIDNLHATNRNAVRRIEDIMGVDKDGNTIVFKSVAKQLEENASWKANAVTFYRRGQKETWITDPFIADVLKMDPYMASGSLSTILDLGRNAVEKTTTGVLAPWFSTTSMIRNHMLIKQSASAGFVPPNMLNTAAAIPQQLYARMANDISMRLDHWSKGWLGQRYGQQNIQGLAQKLAQVYEQSTYAALSQRGGVHTGMFLDYNKQAAQSIGQALQAAPAGVSHTALQGLKALFESIHGSANFAYARKNMRKGVSANAAAMESRSVTGNNTKSGQLRIGSTGKNIRFEDPNAGILSRVADDYARIYGQLHEVGRQSAPWWNVTTQGMKAVGKAYLDNPGKFVANAYMYSVMPSAAVWFYNRGLGTDPNGISYTDYQMNRRTPYDSLMNMYIAIPGRPAEEGIRIPLPHEMATIFAMTSAAMHHMTHTGAFDRPDDFMRTALAMVGKDYKPSMDVPIWSAEQQFGQIIKKAAEVALVPAAPPVVGMVAASAGFTMPEGPFGGAYKKREELNDQNGMNASYELMMRALAPGLADVAFAGWAGMTQDPEEIQAAAGAKAATRKAVEKMPIVRDAIGWKAPVTGSTQTTSEYFEDKGVFRKIDEWYSKRDPENKKEQKEFGGSKQGEEVTDMFMRPAPPPTNMGRNRKSQNQLYEAFMEELHAKLATDTITERGKPGGAPAGGIGMLSHQKRYGRFTKLIKDVKNNDTLPTWTKRIAQEPGLAEYLKKNNVDSSNPRIVRNFLEHERQTAARQIMFTLRAVEQDFGRRLGDPNFKFEKLDPLKPTPLPMGFTPTPFTPQLPPYWMGK